MDHAFGCIEMRLRLDHVQRRLQRLRIGRTLCRLEEAARQPTTERSAADRPSLPVAIDVEVSEAGVVRGVKQFGRLCQVDQDVGLRRVAPAHPAILLRNRLVECRHPTASLL